MVRWASWLPPWLKHAGDEIGETITSEHASETIDELAARLKGHDVAIDFSVGTAVVRHVEACMRAGVPLVQGTTGWKEHEVQVKQLVVEHAGAMVFGANFSIGVNVFYRIVERAASFVCRARSVSAIYRRATSRPQAGRTFGNGVEAGELVGKSLGRSNFNCINASGTYSGNASRWF